MFRFLALLWCIALGIAVGAQAQLPQAHAHNDYAHRRPLMQALEAGFTSIEADIHLKNGELYVAHGSSGVRQKRTLRTLYLEPLRRYIDTHGGAVYSGYEAPLMLMIDIKTDAEATYSVLKQQLEEYRQYLYHWDNGQEIKGPLLIFLSGNRPVAQVKSEQLRLVALDGRPSDLEKNYPASLMPVVSERYSKVISWKGKGSIPAHDLEKLRALSHLANAQGKKLRFWASPEKEKVWQILLDNGIGLIGTDKLHKLHNFLKP
jgi:hypothetical protein